MFLRQKLRQRTEAALYRQIHPLLHRVHQLHQEAVLHQGARHQGARHQGARHQEVPLQEAVRLRTAVVRRELHREVLHPTALRRPTVRLLHPTVLQMTHLRSQNHPMEKRRTVLLRITAVPPIQRNAVMMKRRRMPVTAGIRTLSREQRSLP